jgi:hypothetical protein
MEILTAMLKNFPCKAAAEMKSFQLFKKNYKNSEVNSSVATLLVHPAYFLMYRQQKGGNMKHIKWLILTLLLTVLIASCSPVAHVDKDLSIDLNRYSTYAWVDTRATKDGQSSSSTEFGRLSIQNAVNRKLQQAGWKLVDKDPDVLMTYDILVEKKVKRYDAPAYTMPFARFYYNPYFGRWGTIYFPSRFIGYDTYTVPVREATITVSMMDARTDKKIWQGWTTQKVDSKLLSKREINSGVNAILKKFEPVRTHAYFVSSR